MEVVVLVLFKTISELLCDAHNNAIFCNFLNSHFYVRQGRTFILHLDNSSILAHGKQNQDWIKRYHPYCLIFSHILNVFFVNKSLFFHVLALCFPYPLVPSIKNFLMFFIYFYIHFFFTHRTPHPHPRAKKRVFTGCIARSVLDIEPYGPETMDITPKCGIKDQEGRLMVLLQQWSVRYLWWTHSVIPERNAARRCRNMYILYTCELYKKYNDARI